MTNPIAIALGGLVLVGLAVDFWSYDWSGTIFLARKMADLIEWLAFWR
ncbi:hypothetical protein BXY70_0548 [Roseovarius halotolerans]|mgnify:CR=1 FL=1|uniref:Uncharacterized protein n=1 Tax=Roseovarius halotolerans TaxID=505353 RepID=A0A1X6YI39_9RHOB|nr:hypothetical protein [Roseovarius halotolerans]RKT34530.1 hypothetical protein BXY70_0548 [Roseovarius halotolerans]SLN22262.1 hypothetical protein ROH8110_00847 [Roseovarius halotolerans]